MKRSSNRNAMTYDAPAGEHISTSARNAIAMADKYGRTVQFRFNDALLKVNKRLSVKHVANTFDHINAARRARYRQSAKYREYIARRRAEVAASQLELDWLIERMPQAKFQAADWLAAWIPLSDDKGVVSHCDVVRDMLIGLGFVANEHVGDSELMDGAASNVKQIEYIAGQVIDLIERVGCVHPMLGNMAGKVGGRMK